MKIENGRTKTINSGNDGGRDVSNAPAYEVPMRWPSVRSISLVN